MLYTAVYGQAGRKTEHPVSFSPRRFLFLISGFRCGLLIL